MNLCENIKPRCIYVYEFENLASYRNNWLDDVCSHMIDGKRKNNFWNYDSCKQHAKLCKNRYDFCKNILVVII